MLLVVNNRLNQFGVNKITSSDKTEANAAREEVAKVLLENHTNLEEAESETP